MKNLKKILSIFTLIVVIGSEILTSFSYALNDIIENSEITQIETEDYTDINEETIDIEDEDNIKEETNEDKNTNQEMAEESENEEESTELTEEVKQEVSEEYEDSLEKEDELENVTDEDKIRDEISEDDDNKSQEIDENISDEETTQENQNDLENKENIEENIEEEKNTNLDENTNEESGGINNKNTENKAEKEDENNENKENNSDGKPLETYQDEQDIEEISPTQSQDDEDVQGIIDTISDDLKNIIDKIRFFFKKQGNGSYIKYGKDSHNIGIITLKDPKTSASITIMDKNLGANAVGIGKDAYGYYFQWGNNHGVNNVNTTNKTTEKAVYNDSYYSHGYDGKGLFIVGSTDYWESDAHYNSLRGNESRESSRYGACPAGYHIPTIKEWNQLLNIWGNIHTQDQSTNENGSVLRYSENYSTKNIQYFKSSATQCSKGDTECVEEDKLSTIIEILSSELKLPLAGSYDENGNFHGGLGVYWTSTPKYGNTAGVFDMHAYIGEKENNTLLYKSQGHNIRCFQNLEPYEAPRIIETQNDGELGQEEQLEIQDSTKETQNDEENSQDPLEQITENNEHNGQDSFEKNIPSEFISHSLVLDTTKDFLNIEFDANGGIFSNNESIKTTNYGYYNQETTIDLEALKKAGYYSGYEINEFPTLPIGYKAMDEIELPTREGYIFDGWYTQAQGGKKLDLDNNSISENIKVYAHWTVKIFTITWKNEDGSVRDVTEVPYGEIPTHADAYQPSDAQYTYIFAGWEPKITEVKGNAEYKAKYTYEINKYNVIWENEDGTILKSDKIEYGNLPSYNGQTPNKAPDGGYSYVFEGWTPQISAIKGDIRYKATYTTGAKIYTITWKNEDGTVIDTTEVPYGEMPTHVDVSQPSDAHYSYEFLGWSPQISEVVGDTEYRATYKYNVNEYTVTREDEDGTILERDEGVEYGSIPTYDRIIPEKQPDGIYEYSFGGRNAEISEVTGNAVYIAMYEAKEPQIEDSVEYNASINNQNEESVSLGTEGDNEKESEDRNETVEIDDSLSEGPELGEGDAGFFGGLRETLKSFLLGDEDGYLRGSETINNVIVSVEAEKGTFPDGTEVIIKGVPQDRIESIQTSLVEDKNNNVTEDAQIVAFDISFVYSGEEIQPEKEVSVKFNYKENSDFQGASEKELGVYHIDDETDEGTEIQVASKDGDEIEILATDFSIYVLTLSDSNSIKLTLNPGDGTIITGNNIVVDEQGIGTITSVDGNVTLPNATRENHVFVGRYTSQTPSLQSFVGNGGDEYHVNSNTTLYASWCNNGYTINTEKTTCILEGNLKTILDQNPNFTWGEKEIPMPLGWTNEEDPISIVIMDRNLGATAHGTESNAWGYYYQWGNNYGFTQNPQTGAIHISNVNLSLYAPSTYYSGVFLQKVTGNPTDWATTSNYNIWGYYSGTNEAKQGPCPTNWHVPTIEEWRKVVEYWSGNNGGMNVSNFRAELALPLAGGLTRSAATLESGNVAGFYRTVTPNIPSKFAYDFLVMSDSYDVNYSENLVNGRQVRCFKNEDAIVRRYTVTYNDGIDNREIFEDQIFSGLLRGDDFPQFSGQIPGRTGNDGTYHEFLGWFLEGTEIAFNLSGAKVIKSVSLYAMWTGCPDGEEPNALGFCVPTAEEQRNRQIVQDLELYLLANDQNKKHYTIMDRNMGATEIFNKYYDAPNPASLGYLYQWGNNYGFPAQGDLAQQGVFLRTSQVPKNIWSVGVPSNYASGSYYSNVGSHASWMGSPTKTDGIWGGTGDTRNTNGGNTTLEARQGPCPVGYHVPSTLEWTTIFMDWSGSNIGVSHAKLNNKIPAIYKFSEDLLLPPAGRRGPSGALDYISALSYWSSSPATSDAVRADGLYAKPDDKIEIPNADGRSRARSVRCVKNVVNTSATSIAADDIHLDGGGNAVISIDNGVISTLGTPTRADSTFNGWYTAPDFSGNPLSTGDTVSPGSSLYAKFTCNESGYVWNGIICEDGVRLIFDSMGGTEVSSQLIKSGTRGVRPADPTKTGYAFSGWYLTGANEEFNFTGTIITESTTLYAHWNTGQYEVSIVSNNEDYGTVDRDSVITDFGTPISANGNELTIGSTTVIATPAASGEQYTYTFSGWTFENCGTEGSESVTTNCEITANFVSSVNIYDVTFDSNGGNYTPPTQNIAYGSKATRPTDPTKNGYRFSGWTLNGNDFDFNTVITGTTNLVARWTENTPPVNVNIDTTNDLKAGSQTATISCSDEDGVTKYYFGKNNNPTDNDYTTITNTINFSTGKNVSEAGIYYFACKDEAGTVSEIKNITYDSYIVNNMLEKITGTSGSYNTTNYVGINSNVYIAPRETTLIMSGIYTIPNNASVDTYKGYSTSDNVQTLNMLPSATLSGNATYYIWFDRETYTLDLIINTGIDIINYKVNGADSYSRTQSTLENLTVKAGSEISAYAEAKSGYIYTETSLESPWIITVTGNNIFSPTTTVNTNTQYIVYHYVKRAGENTYALSKTDILSGTTDAVLTLSSLSKESELLCAHYDRGSLTGTESGPGGIVIQTTIKGDGSTKIYLYYIRNIRTVNLTGDEHVQSLEGDGTRRECGSEVPVEATPKPGYHFVRWDKEERREDNENEGLPGEGEI